MKLATAMMIFTSASAQVINFPTPYIAPESMAANPDGGFFLGSLFQPALVNLTADGASQFFTQAPGGTTGIYYQKIQNLLYACGAPGQAPPGDARLLAFNLEDGSLTKNVDLNGLATQYFANVNDLVVLDNGDAYLSMTSGDFIAKVTDAGVASIFAQSSTFWTANAQQTSVGELYLGASGLDTFKTADGDDYLLVGAAARGVGAAPLTRVSLTDSSVIEAVSFGTDYIWSRNVGIDGLTMVSQEYVCTPGRFVTDSWCNERCNSDDSDDTKPCYGPGLGSRKFFSACSCQWTSEAAVVSYVLKPDYSGVDVQVLQIRSTDDFATSSVVGVFDNEFASTLNSFASVVAVSEGEVWALSTDLTGTNGANVTKVDFVSTTPETECTCPLDFPCQSTDADGVTCSAPARFYKRTSIFGKCSVGFTDCTRQIEELNSAGVQAVTLTGGEMTVAVLASLLGVVSLGAGVLLYKNYLKSGDKKLADLEMMQKAEGNVVSGDVAVERVSLDVDVPESDGAFNVSPLWSSKSKIEV